MVVAVYTCIVNNYDTPIIQPKYDGIDYIIYSDNPKFYENYCDKSLKIIRDDLTNTRITRFHKIMFHKLNELINYEYTLYLDGNVKIINDVRDTIFDDFMVYKHPVRNCIYEESEACIKFRKDDKETINKQMEKYKQEGFPKNYGLTCGGILFRKNDEKVREIMEKWWIEVENNSKRDQLSLMYVLWKFNYIVSINSFENINKCFEIPKRFSHK